MGIYVRIYIQMFMCTVNKAIGIYFYTRQLNNEMINETCNNFWNAL